MAYDPDETFYIDVMLEYSISIFELDKLLTGLQFQKLNKSYEESCGFPPETYDVFWHVSNELLDDKGDLRNDFTWESKGSETLSFDYTPSYWYIYPTIIRIFFFWTYKGFLNSGKFDQETIDIVQEILALVGSSKAMVAPTAEGMDYVSEFVEACRIGSNVHRYDSFEGLLNYARELGVKPYADVGTLNSYVIVNALEK